MEIETVEVVVPTEPTTDVVEVAGDVVTTEPQAEQNQEAQPQNTEPSEAQAEDFDLLKIIEEAIASAESPTQTETKEEAPIPTRPTSFENKPVTEKELEGLKSQFETLVSEKEEAIVEKEVQVQELTSKLEEYETEVKTATERLQTYDEFFGKLDSDPII